MESSEQHVRRERDRARELRQSRWWQNRIANAACYYCSKALTRAQATMDHVVPVTQGGCSTPGNVVVSCKDCNNKKRDMTAAEWRLLQDELSTDQ